MANKKYKLTDGNMWATDGIHDFGQNKTQRTINSEVNSALGGKAPTNHASTATTYGAASTSNYGHVKLSNTTPSMDGTAAVGDSTDVARANHVHPSDTSRVPTSRKVNNKQLSSDITLAASDVGAAPTDHASTATTYGKGTSSNYGHVKISDSLTDTTPAATGGVVPSMKAVSDLNGAISDEHDRVTYAFEISAYYETSNIATLRTYSAGDYVIVNDRLWTVTDAVPQGSSFIGHITRAILGNEVKSALTQTIPVNRGGTGQTTVADAKNTFGIPNLRLSSKPIPKQETTVLNIGRNARGMLFIPPHGFYIVSSTSGGSVDCSTVAAVPNVTITPGSYQLTVVSNSAANFYAYYLDFENVAIS